MKENRPLVSIIVPIYNSEDTIKDCVLSIVNQTLKDIEIILIDDGSSDNTGEIIDKLKLEDNRIKVIHKKNEGVSSTRNLGITKAKGEFIGFVDSDDYVDKTMYEKLYTKVMTEKSDMGMCRFCVVKNKYRKEETWDINLDKNNLVDSVLCNMIGMNDSESFNTKEPIMGSTCRCIYKRKIIKNNNLYFNKNITYAEDLIFNLEYLTKINNISMIDEVLYYYKIKKKSLSLGYREDFYNMVKILNRNIIKVCRNKKIKNRGNYAWFRYLIEVLRNATSDTKLIRIKRIKKINEVICDRNNKDILIKIDYSKLSLKNKIFYLIFYKNLILVGFMFYVFRCLKNIIKIG